MADEWGDDWNAPPPRPSNPRDGWVWLSKFTQTSRQSTASQSSGAVPRKHNWTCSFCKQSVCGDRNTCFGCDMQRVDVSLKLKLANNWICNACGALVFGSRTACFKCKAQKGDSKDAPVVNDSNSRAGFSNGNGGSSRFGSSNNVSGNRPNDWICSSCGAKVFGSKTSCFKCGSDKGNSKDALMDDGSSSSQWTCQACGARIFASLSTCFKCNTSKGDDFW